MTQIENFNKAVEVLRNTSMFGTDESTFCDCCYPDLRKIGFVPSVCVKLSRLFFYWGGFSESDFLDISASLGGVDTFNIK
jgi:hypothetical protein